MHPEGRLSKQKRLLHQRYVKEQRTRAAPMAFAAGEHFGPPSEDFSTDEEIS